MGLFQLKLAFIKGMKMQSNSSLNLIVFRLCGRRIGCILFVENVSNVRSMVALKQLRPGKFEIQREDQIEMKNLRELNNDHVVRFIT